MTPPVRPSRPRALAVLAAVATLWAATACSVSTNDEPVAVEDVFDGLVESTTSTTSTSTPEATKPVTVFFVRSSDEETELVPVERDLPVDAGAQQILANLFGTPPTSDGPAAERGLSSAIPETAALRSGTIPTGTRRLVVDTQGLFGEQGVQGPGLRNALGQIVCTVTELDQIDEVSFQNEGRPIGAIVGNNETVDGAVDCSDYRTLT